MEMYIKLYLIILTLMNYGEEKNQLLVMNKILVVKENKQK
jgi:hypothetical protein